MRQESIEANPKKCYNIRTYLGHLKVVKMLKLATVFSGIGAIEHALIRENISHKVVFACDNGDVSPFEFKKKLSFNEYSTQFLDLKKRVKDSPPTSESQKDAIVLLSRQEECIEKLIQENDSNNLKELHDRFNMYYEATHFYLFRQEWEKGNSAQERKGAVDALYKPFLSRNKVRMSYQANYPVTDEHYHWNVSFLEGTPYKNEVDLFVGGSPCQSFSLVGKQRGLSDTRGTLFYEYARLIKECRPKCFIYENVRALLSNDKGRTWEIISKVFSDLGYKWSYAVLNAKDYGIPQNRERVFVVGFREDLELKEEFAFPAPIPLNRTMKDFLLGTVPGKYYLPEKGIDFVLDEGNLKKRYTQVDGDIQLCQKKNQQFNWHGDFVFVNEQSAQEMPQQDLEKYVLSEKVRKYVLASGTKNFYTKPKIDLEIARPLLTSMHKMHRAGVDNYVTHVDGRVRKLAPRECLRLMGFSDSFNIVIPDTPMYQQSGNAIVVDVLIAILNQIKKVLPSIFE